MKTFVEQVGAGALIGGMLALGPAGLLALYFIAYAMMTTNLALGLVFGLMIAAPMVLFLVWSASLAFTLLRAWLNPADKAFGKEWKEITIP